MSNLSSAAATAAAASSRGEVNCSSGRAQASTSLITGTWARVRREKTGAEVRKKDVCVCVSVGVCVCVCVCVCAYVCMLWKSENTNARVRSTLSDKSGKCENTAQRECRRKRKIKREGERERERERGRERKRECKRAIPSTPSIFL